MILAFIFFLLWLFSCAMFLAKLKLWEMHNTLIDWIDIGIANDIVRFKPQRPEYQYYVSRLEKDPVKQISIPKNTIIEIRKDLKATFRPIYFVILWLWIRRKIT